MRHKTQQETRTRCTRSYHSFAAIYADLAVASSLPDLASQYNILHQRLNVFACTDTRDPAKFARIKTQVRQRLANYLACLKYPNAASNNDAAERSLRRLVLKRKISFGSLCERTAETTAILLSMLLSCKQRGTLRYYLAGM